MGTQLPSLQTPDSLLPCVNWPNRPRIPEVSRDLTFFNNPGPWRSTLVPNTQTHTPSISTAVRFVQHPLLYLHLFIVIIIISCYYNYCSTKVVIESSLGMNLCPCKTAATKIERVHFQSFCYAKLASCFILTIQSGSSRLSSVQLSARKQMFCKNLELSL